MHTGVTHYLILQTPAIFDITNLEYLTVYSILVPLISKFPGNAVFVRLNSSRDSHCSIIVND